MALMFFPFEMILQQKLKLSYQILKEPVWLTHFDPPTAKINSIS